MEVIPIMKWTVALFLTSIVTIDCQSSNNYQQQAVDGFNNFTWQLYRQVSSGNSNVFLSGVSAALVIGMVEVGATNQTQYQIQKALGHPNLTETQVLSVYRNVINNATSVNSNSNTLSLANAAFIQSNFAIKEKYRQQLKRAFSAQVTNVNFLTNGTQAIQIINAWVSNQTKGLIDSLYDKPLDPSTVFALVNAVVFLGKWQIMFNQSQTVSAPFYGPNGQVQVQMMNMVANLKAVSIGNPNVSVVELFYTGNQTSMVLVVPNDQNANLTSIVNQLSVSNLNGIIEEAGYQQVILSMPKFNLTQNYSLIPALQNLGIKRVFANNAQLGGISAVAGLKVNQVTQKAVVQVNEEGTQAAVVTGGSGGITTIEILPLRVNANHPFLFLIRHVPSQLIYFLGRASDPTQFS